MQATIFCKANYLMFLDSKDEIIGYQLDESTIKQLKFHPLGYPVEPPDGAKKTLVLEDIWSAIQYEKENIQDVEAKVVTYKINEMMYHIAQVVKSHLNQSKPIDDSADECPAWVSISKEHEDKLFQCEFCINKVECSIGADSTVL